MSIHEGPELAGVVLDRLTHEYTQGSVRYDAVTKVINSVIGSNNPWWKLDHKLRGTFVHKITEAIDDGEWAPELTTFPESLGWDEEAKNKVIQRGYAYQRFIEETGFKVYHQELVVWSDALRVAGMTDKVGLIQKGLYAGEEAVLDIKSGEPTPAAQLQVAFYEILLERSYPAYKGRIKKRIVLHLREDGTCRPYYYHGLGDFIDALSVLNVFRFKERNKLL